MIIYNIISLISVKCIQSSKDLKLSVNVCSWVGFVGLYHVYVSTSVQLKTKRYLLQKIYITDKIHSATFIIILSTCYMFKCKVTTNLRGTAAGF